jgi:hypothetical protein
MRIRLNLKPGQKGTKQLVAQYGDRLICVRYRYDAQRKKRLKTVELLVSECDWEPRRLHSGSDRTVSVRVAFAETLIRERVKKAGGRWDPQRQLWRLPHARAVSLGLAARIVDDPASTDRCREDSAEYLPADAHPASTDRYLHTAIDAGIWRWMPVLQSNCS